jgi:hypothetical protein
MPYDSFVLFISPEVRAAAYVPSWNRSGNYENVINSITSKQGFRDPYPVPPGPGMPLGTTVYHPDVQMLLHYEVYQSLI